MCSDADVMTLIFPKGLLYTQIKRIVTMALKRLWSASGISLRPIRKKTAKRQYPSHEIYLQQLHRKRVEVTHSLVAQLLPKSLHVVTATGFELKVFLFLIATSIKQLFGED